MLPATRPITVADWLRVKRLVDLQHEYPYETFLAVADDSPGRFQHAGERQLLAVVSGYLAFGILPSKAILFRQSEIPHPWRLLRRIQHVRPLASRPVVDGSVVGSGRDGLLLTPLMLFGTTCLALRVTTMVVDSSEADAGRFARHLAASLNVSCNRHVLTQPVLRVLPRGDCAAVAQVALALSPFDARSVNEERLLALCADCGQPKAGCQAAEALRGLYVSITGGDATKPFLSPPSHGDGIVPMVRRLATAIEETFADAACRRDALLQRADDIRDMLREGAVLARREAEMTWMAFEVVA